MTKFYLRRVHLDRNGYDYSGAYWGVDRPLYRFEAENPPPYTDTRSGHIRAKDRTAAKVEVRRLHPDADFFN